MQRVSAEDVVRERLDTVPTPAAEDLAPHCDALRDAEARGVRERSRRSGLLTALVFARPELVALTAPFLLALGAGLALATPPRLSVDVELEHERALEGDEVAARDRARVGDAGRPARRSTCGCRTASSSRTGATRSRCGSRAGERRELELTLRADALGRRT